MLVLKTLNDWIKFSADFNNYRQWQKGQEEVCRLYAVRNQGSCKIVPEDKLQVDDTLVLSSGQVVPVYAYLSEGETIIAEAEELRIYKSGDFINAGAIIREGQAKLQILENGISKEKNIVYLDDVHQPETSYQRNISRAALAGAVLSYLFTGSSLNAIAVLLLMSPSAGNAALSSGLNNCVYRLSRQKVVVPDPNRIPDISGFKTIVIDQGLLRREMGASPGENWGASFAEKLEKLGLQVLILIEEESAEHLLFKKLRQVREDEVLHLTGQSVLVCAAKRKDLPITYTISIDSSPTDVQEDILVFERKLRDLPDILEEICYAQKVIKQSLLFTKAFNIYYGVPAIFQPVNAFAAKSLNTVNSLLALFSNQRILIR